MTGYSMDEAIGLSPSVLADDAEPGSLEQIRAALRGTVPARLEVPGRRKDGSHMWTEWQVVPVADARGQLTHSVAVLRDTTLRRGAEQAVRDSEARFRGLFEQAADAILVLDSNGRIVDANRRACHCLGYTAAELTKLTMADLDAGTRFVDLVPGETLTAENWYRRKDGTEFPVEVRFAVLEEGSRRLRLALVRDLTRRRSAEQALRESEELLRNIIANIPCGVFWKDRDSVYLGCNDQLARDLGLEDSRQVVGKTDYEVCYSRADATFYRDCDREVMRTGEAILNLEESQTRTGGVVTTLLTSKVPLRDSSGEVVGIVGVYQDITERKRLEEQLQQAQKMEAVGRLAGGIAHDFNNLLTIIRGNADLLRSRPLVETRSTELIDDLRLAADRAAALVRQLLMFSRRQPARPEIVDLNDVVSRLGGSAQPSPRRTHRSRDTPRRGARDDPRRLQPSRAGGDEPRGQRPRRDAQRRYAHAPHGGPRNGRRRGTAGARGRASRRRYRRRHDRTGEATDLRTVLHDQGAGQGDRARAGHGVRDRRAGRRTDRGHFRSRRGDHVPDLCCPGARARRAARR